MMFDMFVANIMEQILNEQQGEVHLSFTGFLSDDCMIDEDYNWVIIKDNV
jgi:hypothetical protein